MNVNEYLINKSAGRKLLKYKLICSKEEKQYNLGYTTTLLSYVVHSTGEGNKPGNLSGRRPAIN